MKAVYLSIIVLLFLVLVYPAAGAPGFSGAPGYISLPVVTINGDPGSWTSGIQGFDGDENETAYLFGENRYILKKEHGSPVTNLYDYGSSVWGSFIKLRGETLYFGESTTGSVKTLPAAGGGAHRSVYTGE